MNIEIANRLVQMRKQKGLSQEELAEKLGLSRQAVSKWENDTAQPQGLNRELLAQVLALEGEAPSEAPPQASPFLWSGWIAAGLLFLALLLFWVKATAVPTAVAPAITSVRFYDANQTEVPAEALWYDATRIDSILVQWEGGVPDSVQLFFTPSGTNTIGETRLLLTKSIPNGGEHAILLNGKILADIVQGQLFLEMRFGDALVVTSDPYGLFNPSAILP